MFDIADSSCWRVNEVVGCRAQGGEEQAMTGRG